MVALRATVLAEAAGRAVSVLSRSAKGAFAPTLRRRLQAHFGAHTRAVTEVPYEQQFVDGSHLDWERVRSRTKEAWLDATADRKSTRLNSSHVDISYAVFVMKKVREKHG